MAQNRSINRENHEEEEENLKGAFTSSLIVGVIILLIWISVFMVYLNRI